MATVVNKRQHSLVASDGTAFKPGAQEVLDAKWAKLNAAEGGCPQIKQWRDLHWLVGPAELPAGLQPPAHPPVPSSPAATPEPVKPAWAGSLVPPAGVQRTGHGEPVTLEEPVVPSMPADSDDDTRDEHKRRRR
jgi:hypothetical protein